MQRLVWTRLRVGCECETRVDIASWQIQNQYPLIVTWCNHRARYDNPQILTRGVFRNDLHYRDENLNQECQLKVSTTKQISPTNSFARSFYNQDMPKSADGWITVCSFVMRPWSPNRWLQRTVPCCPKDGHNEDMDTRKNHNAVRCKKKGGNSWFCLLNVEKLRSKLTQTHTHTRQRDASTTTTTTYNLMNRSHCSGLVMVYTHSIAWGLPLEKRALTDVVEISPSSSIMNIPVTSPAADVDASKTFGLSKLNVAMPDDPSLARVNLTSGTTFSSKPRTNSIVAASNEEEQDEVEWTDLVEDAGSGAKACVNEVKRANATVDSRRRWFVMVWFDWLVFWLLLLLLLPSWSLDGGR